jgi:hypothetical protein
MAKVKVHLGRMAFTWLACVSRNHQSHSATAVSRCYSSCESWSEATNNWISYLHIYIGEYSHLISTGNHEARWRKLIESIANLLIRVLSHIETISLRRHER